MADIESMKTAARVLRQSNPHMTHSAALEAVAKAHGYRDWNTASAAALHAARPLELGERVEGLYLRHRFAGKLIEVTTLDGSGRQRLIVQFDHPIDVVESPLFSAFRRRVTATVDSKGISLAKLGNGAPQTEIWREGTR